MKKKIVPVLKVLYDGFDYWIDETKDISLGSIEKPNKKIKGIQFGLKEEIDFKGMLD